MKLKFSEKLTFGIDHWFSYENYLIAAFSNQTFSLKSVLNFWWHRNIRDYLSIPDQKVVCRVRLSGGHWVRTRNWTTSEKRAGERIWKKCWKPWNNRKNERILKINKVIRVRLSLFVPQEEDIIARIATKLCSKTHQAVCPPEFQFRFSSVTTTSGFLVRTQS